MCTRAGYNKKIVLHPFSGQHVHIIHGMIIILSSEFSIRTYKYTYVQTWRGGVFCNFRHKYLQKLRVHMVSVLVQWRGLI
jgi:hypothetical protein